MTLRTLLRLFRRSSGRPSRYSFHRCRVVLEHSREFSVSNFRACVNSHADDGVDADLVERVDLFARGDAAGGGDPPVRRVAHRADGVHVGPLHQALFVHVRVEKLADIGIEHLDRVNRADRERRLPAVDDDLPGAGVDRGDHAVQSDGLGQRPGEIQLHERRPLLGSSTPRVEERGADDDRPGAGGDEILRAADRSDAAADAARQLRRHARAPARRCGRCSWRHRDR